MEIFKITILCTKFGPKIEISANKKKETVPSKVQSAIRIFAKSLEIEKTCENPKKRERLGENQGLKQG